MQAGWNRGIRFSYPTPDDSGVGYKLYSTVPPWLRPEPPLIAAITGGPVPAYCAGVQPGSSEGVSHGAGAEEAFTKRLPLWPSYPRPVFVTASLPCPLYHKLRPVSRSGQKVAIRRHGYCAVYVNPGGQLPDGRFFWVACWDYGPIPDTGDTSGTVPPRFPAPPGGYRQSPGRFGQCSGQWWSYPPPLTPGW